MAETAVGACTMQATSLRVQRLQEEVHGLSAKGGAHMTDVVEEKEALREALEEAHRDRDRLVRGPPISCDAHTGD